MLLLLAGCRPASAVLDGCDPRELADGEVRARQVPCSDELIEGGEGHSGDWLIENAVARYVVRGTYSALDWLEEDGGTLIDAAAVGGMDVLSEYLPEGDRSSIEAENGDGEAALVLPGVTYRLAADDGALQIEATGAGRLRGTVGTVRTGGTVASEDGFFGVDGEPEGDGAVGWISGTTRAAVRAEDLWPDGDPVDADVDADGVVATLDGVERVRLPVVDGHVTGVVPTGSAVRGEREGCVYDGLVVDRCGSLRIRVADDLGQDLDAQLVDGAERWRVPKGGGVLPIGPDPRTLTLWAGPAWEAATIAYSGKGSVTITLPRAFSAEDAVLGAFAEPVAPDADVATWPRDAAHLLAGEGVGLAVLLADDEVPTIAVDPHDLLFAVPASRAAGEVWSWPWYATGRRGGHGAARWAGRSPLDILAISEGGQSAARRTVVTRAWVEAARAEADPVDWAPRPDALWLDGIDDLDTFLGLLGDWVDVVPVGPRTWLPLDGDRNLPAVERGLVDGRTSAGTGPRIQLSVLDGRQLGIVVDAPRWAHLRNLTLTTDLGAEIREIDGALTFKWEAPDGARWVVVSVTGDHATPGSVEPAWAVSSALWLGRPAWQ